MKNDIAPILAVMAIPIAALIAFKLACPMKKTATCYDINGDPITYEVCGCWECTGLPPEECVQ